MMQLSFRLGLATKCIPTLVCVWAFGTVCAALAGEESARALAPAGAAAAKPAETSPQAPPDYKIVFWYQEGHLKSRAYDVRKGQYTKAVDDWVKRIHYDSTGLFVVPGPMATVRLVYLDQEKGAGEPAKLAAAIERLRQNILDSNREAITTAAHLHSLSILDDRTFMRAEPAPRASYRYILPPLVPPGSGGLGAGYWPTPYSYPVPYPYVRPHP